MNPDQQPTPQEKTPDVNNSGKMRRYIAELTERLKRDSHLVGPVKARMMKKRLRKLERQYRDR